MMNGVTTKKQLERQAQVESNKQTVKHSFKEGDIVQRMSDEIPFRVTNILKCVRSEKGDWLSGVYVLPPHAPRDASAYTEDVELVEIPHLDTED
jgi:hypothetical protein